MKFDEVTSLGYNCEVGFRIQDYFGLMDSYPYSWAYCLDRKLFLESLDNLDDILTGDITLMPSGMFRCEKYQISFHASKEKDALFVDGKPNEEVVRLELASLKKKIKHLVEKFYSLFQSDKKSLFVIKVKHSESDENIKFVKDLFKKIDPDSIVLTH